MRPATRYDIPAIIAACKEMIEYSPAPQMKFANIEIAATYIGEAIRVGHAVVHGDFFILFDIGRPWYSDKEYLIEDLIIRISRDYGTRVDEAISCLHKLAEERGCVAVAAGDTQVGYMTPKYHAQGYTTLGTQLFKET